VTASSKPRFERLAAVPAVVVGAVALRVISGVGFANYDTLYALAWGGQLARGEQPAYGVAIAPTPHPLVEALGVALYPLGPRADEQATVWLCFLALAACGWLVYRLASLWFGHAAGVVAALVLLTRVPILSYGVRAYIDVPYLLLVLCALLLEARRRAAGEPPAGAPVLALLALAGLLRPEAWAFSGLYWLYLVAWERRAGRATAARRAAVTATTRGAGEPAGPAAKPAQPRSPRALAGLTLLAAAAPLVWVLSDLAVTGDALWSLTNTRHTAHTLDRVTGIANVPEYVPRRIGEILRPPVLAGAAIGGVLSLWWLRRRALDGAVAGVLAVLVFIVVAAAGLPINTRYAFLTAAILCVFCGAGAFGWTRLAREDPRRRWWMAAGAVVLVALIAFTPAQVKSAHREMGKLARQEGIQEDLLALVRDHAINLACGPVGVPNHAPVPLLALYLKTSPANVTSAQVGSISYGVYVDPASKQVEDDYVLDPHDPHLPVNVPPGFLESRANRSWLIFQRCS
jgi:Dolichyl-phosphate-mannose-protein mannosyltransferase